MFSFLSLGQSSQSMKKFISENREYIVSYPNSWSFVDNKVTDFIFLAPSEIGKKFNDNINLIKSPKNGLSKSEYIKNTLNQLNKYLVGFSKETQGKAVINDLEFEKIEYSHFVNNMRIRVSYYLIFHKGNAYEFTCSSDYKDSRDNSLTFQIILNSFVFQ